MFKLRLMALLGISLALVGPALAEAVTIGIAGPMTGQYAPFGQQLQNGADLAIADINAAGGVSARSSAEKLATTPAIPSRRGRSPRSSPRCRCRSSPATIARRRRYQPRRPIRTAVS